MENKSTPGTSIQVIENQINESLTSFNELGAKVNEFIPQMISKAQRADTALSQFTVIDNDEVDAEAAKILLKVKNTYESIYKMRKEMTDVTDQFKKMAMMPEKLISTLSTDSASNYNRVKKLRDDYANFKYQEKLKIQKQIQFEKDKNDEIIRLKNELQKRAEELVIDQLTALNSSISTFIQGLTYENFDVNIKKLNATPKLKIDVYEKIFVVGRNTSLINDDEFNELINEVKKLWTYDVINTQYVNLAQVKIDEWKNTFPETREKLKAIYETGLKNKEEAERLKAIEAERLKAEQLKAIEDAEREKKEKREEIESKMMDEKLDNDFESQVKNQIVEEDSNINNVRKSKYAVITAPNAKIVQVIAQVIHACFMNPEFKGYMKKDKAGNIIMNDGVPEYEDWLSELLSFYVKKCDVKIDGIEIREKISTINKR